MALDDLIEQIQATKPERIELSHDEWTKVSACPHDALEVLLDKEALQRGIIGRVLGVPIYITEAREAWGRMV